MTLLFVLGNMGSMQLVIPQTPILAVELSEQLVMALRERDLLFTTTPFQGIYELIESGDYTTVLFDLRNSCHPYDDVMEILSITPLTTRIVSVYEGSSEREGRRLKKLGVEQIGAPVTPDKICAACLR